MPSIKVDPTTEATATVTVLMGVLSFNEWAIDGWKQKAAWYEKRLGVCYESRYIQSTALVLDKSAPDNAVVLRQEQHQQDRRQVVV